MNAPIVPNPEPDPDTEILCRAPACLSVTEPGTGPPTKLPTEPLPNLLRLKLLDRCTEYQQVTEGRQLHSTD